MRIRITADKNQTFVLHTGQVGVNRTTAPFFSVCGAQQQACPDVHWDSASELPELPILRPAVYT